MEGEEGGREEQVDGQVHEGNNEEEEQMDEGQEEEGLQQKEMEGETSNREEGEREKENVNNNNEQTMEQDTHWREMETSDSSNNVKDDVEGDGQRKMDRNKEMDSEEEIKMDNMDKDRGGRGQIRRRATEVKPHLECVRKKVMKRIQNRYDVLRDLEGENDEQ